MSVVQESQKLSTSALVTLFTLDTTPIGGSEIFRFTAGARTGQGNVTFDQNVYTAIDVEASGFEWDGKGAFPKPKMRVSNVAGLVSAAIVGQNDLIGARLTRIRTFEKFLDDGSTPDPTAMFPAEIYTVEQKSTQNKVYVEWILSSILDQADRQLPGRICLRDRCTHVYRTWDGTGYDYTNVSCPYVGTLAWDENGNEVAQPNDDCGRKLSDCKLRFGEFGDLPTRAFPGIARTRVQ